MISSATELFYKLKECGYDDSSRDPWWWPQSGTFECVIGAILTQNTTWSNVEKALENLKSASLLDLESLSIAPLPLLEELVRPSGYYRTKAKNILQLSKNIQSQFTTFSNFQELVTREWLLAQRGIGPESADAILNFACYQEAFVVDNYTKRLLMAFGYDFEHYDLLQEWIVDDFYSRYSEVYPTLSRAQAYARAHGMIVNYCKEHKKGKVIDITHLV